MNNKEEIASEMHRWGRMTGAFSIIVMVTWVALGQCQVLKGRLGGGW